MSSDTRRAFAARGRCNVKRLTAFSVLLCLVVSLMHPAQGQEGRAADEHGKSSPVIAEEPVLVKEPDIIFAGLEESKRILSTRDDYIAAMGPFDPSARMRIYGQISEEEFLQFLAKNAVAWLGEEKVKIAGCIDSVMKKIKPFKLTFPEKLLLVKTTEKTLKSADAEIERHLIDNLFHIFLRHNPQTRRDLCSIIGFVPCNEIEIPGELLGCKITDPDAVHNDHYITVSYKGSAVDVIPFIYGVPGACGSAFGSVPKGRRFCGLSFSTKLLVLERQGDNFRPRYEYSLPVVFDATQVAGFYEKVGRNSKLIFHPDEIIADNFVMLANGEKNLPTPRIIESMRELLTTGDVAVESGG